MPTIIYDHTKGLFQKSGSGIAFAPQLVGETVSDTGKGTFTATAGVETVDYTGAATCTITLPAATVGEIYAYVQCVDPQGGVNKLIINCASGEAYETTSTVESRNSNEVTFVQSTAGQNSLQFTPTDNVNNFFGIGSKILFTCVNSGKWHVDVQPKHGRAGNAQTGAFAFATV